MTNILIIKLGALGDVVMATSLIHQILEAHREDDVTLMTCKPYSPIFGSFKNLHTHLVERKGFTNTLKNIAWMRRGGFKRVYDLQSNDRTGLYCALSGIPDRVGNHPRFPYNIHPDDAYEGHCHIYERMLVVLKAAGIDAKNTPPTLYTDKQGSEKVCSWLHEHNLLDDQFIIIHAGCSKQRPEKRWPYYQQLAKLLSKQDKQVVWVGADDEIGINKQLGNITGIDASNKFSFSELVELGHHASFAITNDSGPMHILSGSGIPVYSFFGPSNWKRNHAIGQRENVLSVERFYGSPENKQTDLGLISVEQVIDTLSNDKLINISQ